MKLKVIHKQILKISNRYLYSNETKVIKNLIIYSMIPIFSSISFWSITLILFLIKLIFKAIKLIFKLFFK